MVDTPRLPTSPFRLVRGGDRERDGAGKYIAVSFRRFTIHFHAGFVIAVLGSAALWGCIIFVLSRVL